MDNFYSKLAEISTKDQKSALCIIISTLGSTPRKTGTKMIVAQDGSIVGTIGGGLLEKRVIDQALEVLKSGESQVFKHILTQKEGMGCGGQVEVYIEPVSTPPQLYIFGAGHIGKTLAKQAGSIGFNVSLIDDRREMFENYTPDNISCIHADYRECIESLSFSEETYIVVMTYDHDLDRSILQLCLKKPYKYIGMIGSKAKVETSKKILKENGVDENTLEKINWPIGIGIACQTPEEIAISILAKLIDTRRK